MTKSMKQKETIHRRRRDIRNKLFKDVLVGIFFGIVVLFGSSNGFKSFAIKELYATLLAIFAGAWLSNFIEFFKTYPERTAQKYLSKWRDQYPELTNLIEIRFNEGIEAFYSKIHQVTGGSGEEWTTDKRLQTANAIFDGAHKILSYCAICTDPPYLQSSATRGFYKRQAKRLQNSKTRRLLVFPIAELIKELNDEERFNYLNEYIGFHREYGIDLRYWPHSIKNLKEDHLEVNMGDGNTRLLVDFGILKDSLQENPIVFGQEATSDDEDRVRGKGHVITLPGEVGQYVEIFDLLWEQTKNECYPAAQLTMINMLSKMRKENAQTSHSAIVQDGNQFFNECVDHIKCANSMCAIDVAEDMAVWWQKNEYIKFRDATIFASNSGKQCSRMYVLKKRFDTLGKAELFIKDVINPQVNAGVEIGLVYSGALVDKDIGAIDCVFDDLGWGFYLMPRDSFSTAKVSMNKNLINSNLISDFRKLHEDVKRIVESHGRLLGKNYDDTDLVQWLAPR